MQGFSAFAIAATGFVASILFIYGLRRMSSPATAASGIRIAGLGMLAAVVASFLYAFDVGAAARPHLFANLALALLALAIGGGFAWWKGRTVAMTAMPQMVAVYNAMGGGAAGAIAATELFGSDATGTTQLFLTLLGAFIGAVSFSGSLVAWAKLDGRIGKPLRLRGQRPLDIALVGLTVALGGAIMAAKLGSLAFPVSQGAAIGAFFGLAILFGIVMTLPIGGADMPVVISVYNAFTGLAVAFEGFVLQNPALMIAGMVVGAAGTLLTLLMAKAMNRSIVAVLFQKFGPAPKHKRGASVAPRKSVEPADAAIFMRYAKSVVVVPGYGLAVSQGQQKLYEFVKLLVAAGVSVKFAIHPVAGRMPGQMDVLLAEAGVPYDMIVQLADINPEFATTDVALVIGANDVVNPAARTDKTSPIYGMPILDADHAKHVYVLKRGEGTGYAGIANALFSRDTCEMVYGDAQVVLGKMVEAVRALGAVAAA